MNLVTVFQDFKRIHGFCPCCQKLFRLSEIILFTRQAPPHTDFDSLAADWSKVEHQRQLLDEQYEALQEQARLKGRIAAQERLRLFQLFFSGHGLNVKDVRVLFDPVDYLAFRGLADGDCKEVIVMDREPDSNHRERLHNSLGHAIDGGNLEWKTVRIADDGTVTFK